MIMLMYRLRLFVFGLILLVLGTPVLADFSDVTADNADVDAINYVKSVGIMSGYPDGRFNPNGLINRAEITKIATLAFYQKQTTNNCTSHYFSDVPQDTWYTSYLCSAYNHSLIAGYDDGTFHPNSAVTFVESAKILTNAFDLIQKCTSGSCSNIQNPSMPWYTQYVTALLERNAVPATILRFDQPVTRGEIAEMIYRLKNNITYKQSRIYQELAVNTWIDSPMVSSIFDTTTPTLVYKNVTDGWGIEYPKNWSIQDSATFSVESGKNYSGTIFAFPNKGTSLGTAQLFVGIGNDCPSTDNIQGFKHASDHVEIDGKPFDFSSFILFKESLTELELYTYSLPSGKCIVIGSSLDTPHTYSGNDKSSEDQVTSESSILNFIFHKMIRSFSMYTLSANTASSASSASSSQYINTQDDYQITYPSDWIVKENDLSGVFGKGTTFFAPADSFPALINPQIHVAIQSKCPADLQDFFSDGPSLYNTDMGMFTEEQWLGKTNTQGIVYFIKIDDTHCVSISTYEVFAYSFDERTNDQNKKNITIKNIANLELNAALITATFHSRLLPTPSSASSSQFTTYDDPQGNYTIGYPRTWNIEPNTTFNRLNLPEQGTLFSIQKSGTGGAIVSDSLFIKIVPICPNITSDFTSPLHPVTINGLVFQSSIEIVHPSPLLVGSDYSISYTLQKNPSRCFVIETHASWRTPFPKYDSVLQAEVQKEINQHQALLDQMLQSFRPK